MDEYLKNGALTEGVHNMTSADKLKAAMKDGFQCFGDVEADLATSKDSFWLDQKKRSSASGTLFRTWRNRSTNDTSTPDE